MANDFCYPDVVVCDGHYEKYEARMGPRRNGEMVDYADVFLTFWDGDSNGTVDNDRPGLQNRFPRRYVPS